MMTPDWHIRRNTLRELEEYTNASYPKCGWYCRGGAYMLVVTDACDDGFRLYCWNGFDPRPLFREALALPVVG